MEDLAAIAVKRAPRCAVLRISAVLLEAERAVGAGKDIDAIVAILILDRLQDLIGHGISCSPRILQVQHVTDAL